jgi:hypothetical protein
MKEKAQYVKKQHYIPCCVLKHFKESDDVHNRKKSRIFHILHQKGEVYPSIIQRVMFGEYFYEHPEFAINEIEGKLRRYEDWYSKELGQLISLISEYDERRIKFNAVKTQVFKIVEPMILMHLRSGAMMYELKFWREGRHSLDSLLSHVI